ncbi:hypothetical protein [Leptospira kirschneri]|nr:hypothetical protein [Leptospira kirschneri]
MSFEKMRSNSLKVLIPTILESIRKIVICSSSHILRMIYKVQIQPFLEK